MIRESLRSSGIDIIGDLVWGTHFCLFYQRKGDLVDILVPYFKAGLENSEFCVWIVSQSLEVEEAKEALRWAVPDLDIYLEKGQIEIFSCTDWYLKGGTFDPELGLSGWIKRFNSILDNNNYYGTRISWDLSWLKEKGWNCFIEYEKEVDDLINNYPIIALCAYPLDRFNSTEIIDLAFNHQFTLVKKDGEWGHLEGSRGKKIEIALQESEERFRSVLENSLDSAYRLDLQSNYFDYMSPVIKQITGFSPEEIKALSSDDLLNRIHPDDRQLVIMGIARSLNEGFGTHEYRFRCKDGKYRWLADHFSIIRDKAGIPRFRAGIVRNMTERKKAEEAFKLSNIYNRSLIEASLDPLVTIGADGKIMDVNNATELVTGRSREELIGTDFSDYFTEPEQARKGYQRVFVHGEVRDYPLEIQHKDGNITPVLYNASVYRDETGKVIGVFAAARDITERKKAEEILKKAHDILERKVKERTAELEKAYRSLKESEAGLAEAQKMAHIGNWDWDLLTGKAYWSDELYRIFGRNPQKGAPSYDELLSYVHPEDRDYVDKSIKKGLNEQPKNSIDYRIILANQEERKVRTKAEVIFDEQNIPIRVKGIIQDITELKKAEEKIQLLVDAVESSNDAIATLSLEGIVLSWNKGAEQIYGYSAEDIIGRNISITEPDFLKGEIRRFSERIKQGEKSCHYETLRVKKDGTTINISAALSPVFNSSQKLVAILAIARNISERVKAEQELAKINKIRIKEIHHRIKNNLQVISSLLDLQAERFQNKEILEAFRESQNRVISMALIHEELYKGGGAESIDFSVYLQKLAENLFQTYRLSSRNVRLYMDVEQNTFFDIDIAVPLGIIVNELVSNSLKHAFAENQEGEIKIQLSSRKKDTKIHESTFDLTISDNGKGIPDDVNFENLESLGLKLVKILVEQLDGKIELKKTHGTEFKINFSVIESS